MLLAAVGALLGLVVAGVVSPAAAQAVTPRAAADTTGGTTSSGTSGSTTSVTGGTSGSTTSVTGGTSGSTTSVTGGTSAGTTTVTGGTSAGTTTVAGGTSAGTTVTGGANVGGTGDPTQPTTPTNLTFVSATPTSITMTWDPSTDDVGITGYGIRFLTGDGAAGVGVYPTNTATVMGLRPHSGYQFVVYSIDTDGYESLNSAWILVHTTDVPETNCSVHYRLVDRWSLSLQGEGFEGELTIPNTGSTPISDWTLSFEYTNRYFGGSTITGMWGGSFTQTQDRAHLVTVTPARYTSTIPAGGSVTIGFIGTDTSINEPPPYFTLNGTICATATDDD